MIRIDRIKRPTRCYVCGKPMTALCDATRKDGKPCNAPMCDEHKNTIGPDMDVCEYHNHPKYTKQAINNRVKRDDARKYFQKKMKDEDFGIVPGHHPDFATITEVDKWISIQKELLKVSREIFDKQV
jgi:hypothetical protein